MRLAVAILLAVLSTTSIAAAQFLPDIRVVLADDSSSYTVAGDLVWYVDDRGAGSTTGQVLVSLSGSKVIATIAGNRYEGQRIVAEARTGNVRCLNLQFHGRIEFFRGQSGSLVALNSLPLDDYVAGVVPSEMPHSWPPEALKAQAVAARTYAVARMAVNAGETFDVYSTVADQAYKGAGNEQQTTTLAVRQTAGQVLTYEGKVITAYYSSDAGGYTKDGGQPYLLAVPSYAPDSSHNNWSINLSPAQLLEIARREGFTASKVNAVTATNDSVSGHLLSLVFEGSGSTAEITGPLLRKKLGYSGLKSTRVTVSADGQILTAAPPAYVPPPVKQTPVVTPSGTFPLFGYNRPSVASVDGITDLKLRGLYAYNGWDLMQCNREVFAIIGTRFAGPVPEPTPQVVPRLLPVQTRVEPGVKGIVLNGSGYGHGIGLSQWGARQLAAEGMDYMAILLYFYTGVELVNWDGSQPSAGDSAPGTGFYDPYEIRLN